VQFSVSVPSEVASPSQAAWQPVGHLVGSILAKVSVEASKEFSPVDVGQCLTSAATTSTGRG